MEKIEIEKGVQMVAGVRASRKYPFSEMQEVGDSFFIRAETSDAAKSAAVSVSAAARRFSKGVGLKFSVKKVVEVEGDGKVKNGVRCWRVA